MKNRLLISMIAIAVILGVGVVYWKTSQWQTDDSKNNSATITASEPLPAGYDLNTYQVEKILQISCSESLDCATPAEYLIKSNCPYNSLCLDKKCTVICPGKVATTFEYQNQQYDFQFTLPNSWQGYSIVEQNWTGTPLDSDKSQTIKGPEILIRHPQWTTANPRQDIPVMIFNPAQWDLVQQEKIALGAAPVGPTEIARNDNYIFAIPARYNFAFLAGFEEVEKIIESKPLHILQK